MAQVLYDDDGDELIIQEGESANIVVTLFDIADVQISEATIATLTATLFDETTETVINSRLNQNVLDANGGTVDANGVLTLRLQAADNPIVGTLATGKRQVHCLDVKWTWSDGVLTRTGKSGPLTFKVEKVAEPT